MAQRGPKVPCRAALCHVANFFYTLQGEARQEIVFYGAGKHAREFARRHCIEAHRIRLPDYVVDRDPAKWETDLLGIPIVPRNAWPKSRRTA